MDIEKSYDKWTNLREELEEQANEKLNESETRLKIIDCIFVDILGWSKASISAEYSIGSSEEDTRHKKLYADYLVNADLNSFLIEAKRNTRYFSIPKGSKKVFKSERGVLRTSSNNGEFMDQAIKYMNRLGTPFCVLCNGLQLMVIRRKLPSISNDVVVFRDANDIERRFLEFWAILSPYSNGIEELDRILSTPDEIRLSPPFSKRISDSIYNKNSQIKSSNAAIATQNYISTYFSDINKEHQIQLLKDCYCDPGGRFTSFAEGLKQQILAAPLNALERLTVMDKFGDFGNFQKKYEVEMKEENGAVFVLIGGVGAGKSTFVEHFYQYELDENIRKKLVWINLNFLDFTKTPDKVDDFITESLVKLLGSNKYKFLELGEWENLVKIYADEIEQLISGMPPHMKLKKEFVDEKIWDMIVERKSNQEQHLLKQFLFIKNELDMNICFVFDNTDQKSFEVQNEILMNAFMRAEKYKSTIITSLRSENYFLIKDKSPFDAYQPITFRIEPPTLKELLQKRLEASRQSSNKEFTLDHKGKVIKVSIDKFVNILKNTLEDEKDNSVERLFESVSGGNMRRGLLLFKDFIQSGHTRLYEKLDLLKNLKNIKLDYNESFDSLAKGENLFYSSIDSRIENLFYYENDGFYSHFTKIYILKYLYSKTSTHLHDGYITLAELYEKFSLLFVSPDKMGIVLQSMLEKFLIDSDYGEREKWISTKAIRISPLGQYYLEVLLRDWNYFKNIMMDTPIHEEDMFRKLNHSVSKLDKILNANSRVKKNIECINMFLSYLQQAEMQDVDFLSSQGSLPFKPVMEEIIRDFNVSCKEELKNMAPV